MRSSLIAILMIMCCTAPVFAQRTITAADFTAGNISGCVALTATGTDYLCRETTDPAPTVTPPLAYNCPESVTPKQFRRALLATGLLETVETYMSTTAPAEVRIDWLYANEIRRDYPGIVVMAGALGKTSEELDALFTLAATY